MKHFGISEWADFARGLVAEPEVTAMQSHLSQGCGRCRELADFSASLAGVCQAMAHFDPPADTVHNAKAIFPATAPARRRRTSGVAAELVYDSFLVPAPAGLRATWQVGWQALYRAGDCSLDLRMEPELSSMRAALIGQVNNHVAPRQNMDNAPVLLKSGRTVVAETRSNRFGEFQMEYEQQPRLQLCLYLEDGAKSVHVSLKKLAAERHSGIERMNLAWRQLRPKQEKQ